MYQIRQTSIFSKWLVGLQDTKGKARILARLESCRLGNLGDCKSVGGGIKELRIHAGPGYRLYFTQQRKVVLLLLCGGRKSSQSRGIEKAHRLLAELEGD
ncbi:MAG: type II toxin-antitoxin system RelE/ParE family toxin [Gammaproteobacteria bacterium]|nr:type II toxin-antitoxin system RelE/ParE family toxin [Gammaproteobacteria bacterium]